MAHLYKLTNANYETYQMKWGKNVTNSNPGERDFFRCYMSPETASFLNPIYEDFENPVLWLVEGAIVASNYDSRMSCKTLTTLDIVSLPKISLNQRIEIGIKCALKVYRKENFVVWTNNWLDNKDRSYPEVASAAYEDAVKIMNDSYYSFAISLAASSAVSVVAATCTELSTYAEKKAAYATINAMRVANTLHSGMPVNLDKIIKEVIYKTQYKIYSTKDFK
jgi:hypothetical protein